jgi:hypothetical protein
MLVRGTVLLLLGTFALRRPPRRRATWRSAPMRVSTGCATSPPFPRFRRRRCLFVKAGRVPALATTGARRSPLLPDVPTIKEAGVANAQADIWYGILAPAATPPDVIEALAKATMSVTTSTEFSHRMLELGVEPSANTPAAFRTLLQEEVARWAEVAKAAHIQAD